MLATFYAKALDADLENPILGDRFAKEIVDRIDYDWKKTLGFWGWMQQS